MKYLFIRYSQKKSPKEHCIFFSPSAYCRSLTLSFWPTPDDSFFALCEKLFKIRMTQRTCVHCAFITIQSKQDRVSLSQSFEIVWQRRREAKGNFISFLENCNLRQFVPAVTQARKLLFHQFVNRYLARIKWHCCSAPEIYPLLSSKCRYFWIWSNIVSIVCDSRNFQSFNILEYWRVSRIL